MNDSIRMPVDGREAELEESRTETFTPANEAVGERLDRYLTAVCDLTRAAAVRLIESGAVVLMSGEGKGRRSVKVDKNTKLKSGDEVIVTFPEAEEYDVIPEDIPLDVVYEDADIIVVNKPTGMVVHPAPGNYTGTLVNALLHHCGDSLSGVGGVKRPGIVHRIDKDTSGLLVVAKNDAAHNHLSEQLKTHDVARVYYAIALGNFKEDRGTVHAAIDRHPTDRKKMAITKKPDAGRDAITHYEVLERYGAFTLIRCKLETGRTHQIRVHMASLGHPLLGDPVYRGDGTRFEADHRKYVHGQCLHAGELVLTHPRTEQKMHFEAPLPADFAALLDILRRLCT